MNDRSIELQFQKSLTLKSFETRIKTLDALLQLEKHSRLQMSQSLSSQNLEPFSSLLFGIYVRNKIQLEYFQALTFHEEVSNHQIF